MECQSCDSKKLLKVFDASKRKRNRKIREGHDDANSVVTDDTASGQGNGRSTSAMQSLHDVPTAQAINMNKESKKRSSREDRDSSPTASSPSPADPHHKRSSTDTRRSEVCNTRSPRRSRRRDEMSLALKAGLISPATSASPRQGHDEDSIIYTFLEDAIKKEKKKERQSRRHDDHWPGQRHTSVSHRHRHHHHHRKRCEETLSRDRDKSIDLSTVPAFNQAALIETFAKLCAQFNEKSPAQKTPPVVQHSHSHKSLQCEVMSKHDYHDVDQRPTRLLNRTEEQSRENVARIRSQDNFRGRHSQDRVAVNSRHERVEKQEKHNYNPQYEKEIEYVSKLDLTSSRMRTTEDRYQEYQQNNIPDRNFPEQYKTRPPHEYREYQDYERERRNYEEKRYVDQRTSRSFDVREHREGYPDEEKWRRTTRSDNPKDRRYDPRDRRYDERDKYYDDRTDRERYNLPHRDSRRSRRISDRFERNSVVSRDDDYRDRDRYSEKERDSGLSVADGETSTVSGKSNYLRAMKQEIVEQREAMDKMMKLWKELMRCFKGLSPQSHGQEKAVHENAANVRESAAAQLRLWRECMRRYETVARDVGDTDARLMEEINKQRSEMAEMASMWQECLQRYREMSTDFNSLKQQLTPPEPVRLPAAPPAACAEGEGSAPAPPYRLPPSYPPQMPPMAGYGSPLRGHASVPPAWWWSGDARPSPRRRSSPDSRGSRDRERERRHRQKGGRDDTRYKDKPSKPSAARSEHRHRKR